jgi:hypothetical protein
VGTRVNQSASSLVKQARSALTRTEKAMETATTG